MPMLAAAWPQILEAPPVSFRGRPTLQRVQPSCSELVAQVKPSPGQQAASQHTRGHPLSSHTAASRSHKAGRQCHTLSSHLTGTAHPPSCFLHGHLEAARQGSAWCQGTGKTQPVAEQLHQTWGTPNTLFRGLSSSPAKHAARLPLHLLRLPDAHGFAVQRHGIVLAHGCLRVCC